MKAPEPYYEDRPWFEEILDKHEFKENRNVLGAWTGGLGIGKSYTAIREAEKRDPSFTIDRIVFNPGQFWETIKISTGRAYFVWDEPNSHKGLSNRGWYESMNRAVSSFIQTGTRYRRKHILFALPLLDLLDKAVRVVTLFEGQMLKPGVSKIMRLKPNRFGTPEIWKGYMGEVQRGMPNSELVKAYEDKRAEFHETDYEKSQFEEPVKEGQFERTLRAVKANPERYKDPLKGKLSVNMIIGDPDLNVSDKVARRVLARLEFENQANIPISN